MIYMSIIEVFFIIVGKNIFFALKNNGFSKKMVREKI
jgi:hypothetical protein